MVCTTCVRTIYIVRKCCFFVVAVVWYIFLITPLPTHTFSVCFPRCPYIFHTLHTGLCEARASPPIKRTPQSPPTSWVGRQLHLRGLLGEQGAQALSCKRHVQGGGVSLVQRWGGRCHDPGLLLVREQEERRWFLHRSNTFADDRQSATYVVVCMMGCKWYPYWVPEVGKHETAGVQWTQLAALLVGRVRVGAIPIVIHMHDLIIELPDSVLLHGGSAVHVCLRCWIFCVPVHMGSSMWLFFSTSAAKCLPTWGQAGRPSLCGTDVPAVLDFLRGCFPHGHRGQKCAHHRSNRVACGGSCAVYL